MKIYYARDDTKIGSQCFHYFSFDILIIKPTLSQDAVNYFGNSMGHYL